MARRVLLGKFPDGGYGLRVSKPGWDVMMNPVNDWGMLFNSDWASCLPIHWKSGYFTIGAGAAFSLWFEDLGYTPFIAAVYQNPYGSSWAPVTGGYAIPHYSPGSKALAIQASSNNVYLNNNSHSSTIALSIVVYKVQAF